MLIKIHKTYRDVVAICDSKLIGKTFEEGKFQLDVKKSFFEGEEMPEERLIQVIQKMSKEDATFNIVGEKSTNTALKSGIISKQEIKKIQGVPFALILI